MSVTSEVSDPAVAGMLDVIDVQLSEWASIDFRKQKSVEYPLKGYLGPIQLYELRKVVQNRHSETLEIGLRLIKRRGRKGKRVRFLRVTAHRRRPQRYRQHLSRAW